MWCEICETGGHDILNCTSMFGSGQNTAEQKDPKHEAADDLADEHPVEKTEPLQTKASSVHSDTSPALKTGRDVVMEGLKGISGLGSSIGSSMAPIAGKSSGVIDESKWCALCERDGHESIDCPLDE